MPGAWLVLNAGSGTELLREVDGRLHVGRECAGVAAAHRILVDDPSVSRDHAEVRVDAGVLYLIDHSTNGTRLNGRWIERGERLPVHDGDHIEIGTTTFVVRTDTGAAMMAESGLTLRADSVSRSAILVGDIVGYTGLSERFGAAEVARSLDGLFGELHRLVADFEGMVSNYAGDAILAVWEIEPKNNAVAAAIECALNAHDVVRASTPGIALRYPDGEPIRLGWAVTVGDIATSRPSPARVTVLGDAVNLAFRLAGTANRGGLAPVLVEVAASEAAQDAADYGPVATVLVKGRTAPATVRQAQRPSA